MFLKRLRGPRDLKAVLGYRNETVIGDFLTRNPMPRAEAELIFQETLKWLWLCSLPEREENRGPVTHAPMQVVDEMWHSFILCTRDYQRFCDENLGGYIHHQPIVDIPARKLRKV